MHNKQYFFGENVFFSSFLLCFSFSSLFILLQKDCPLYLAHPSHNLFIISAEIFLSFKHHPFVDVWGIVGIKNALRRTKNS